MYDEVIILGCIRIVKQHAFNHLLLGECNDEEREMLRLALMVLYSACEE